MHKQSWFSFFIISEKHIYTDIWKKIVVLSLIQAVMKEWNNYDHQIHYKLNQVLGNAYYRKLSHRSTLGSQYCNTSTLIQLSLSPKMTNKSKDGNIQELPSPFWSVCPWAEWETWGKYIKSQIPGAEQRCVTLHECRPGSEPAKRINIRTFTEVLACWGYQQTLEC